MNKRGNYKKNDFKIKENIKINEYQERIKELYKYFNDVKYNLIALNKKFDVLENYFKHNIKEYFMDKSKPDDILNDDDIKYLEDNFQSDKQSNKEDNDSEFFKNDSDEENKNKQIKNIEKDNQDNIPKFNEVLFDYKSYNTNNKTEIKKNNKISEIKNTSWINKNEDLQESIPLSFENNVIPFNNPLNNNKLKKEEKFLDIVTLEEESDFYNLKPNSKNHLRNKREREKVRCELCGKLFEKLNKNSEIDVCVKCFN